MKVFLFNLFGGVVKNSMYGCGYYKGKKNGWFGRFENERFRKNEKMEKMKKWKKVLTKKDKGGIMYESQAKVAEVWPADEEKVKKILKKFQKPLDKSNCLWYNI